VYVLYEAVTVTGDSAKNMQLVEKKQLL